MSSRSDTNAVIARATKCPHGWVKLRETNSRGHHIVQLPDGRKYSYSTSPSDVNAARNLAKNLGKMCGCATFWARNGHQR